MFNRIFNTRKAKNKTFQEGYQYGLNRLLDIIDDLPSNPTGTPKEMMNHIEWAVRGLKENGKTRN